METLIKVVFGEKISYIPFFFAENPIDAAYPYEKRPSEFVKKLTVMLPVYHSGSYHAAAVVGEHGTEGVSCAVETENGYSALTTGLPRIMSIIGSTVFSRSADTVHIFLHCRTDKLDNIFSILILFPP